MSHASICCLYTNSEGTDKARNTAIMRKPITLSGGHTGLRIAFKRPLYDQCRINFPHSVDRSHSVGAEAYLCGCWARISPLLNIGNRCDSKILSNPTIWCDRCLTNDFTYISSAYVLCL